MRIFGNSKTLKNELMIIKKMFLIKLKLTIV